MSALLLNRPHPWGVELTPTPQGCGTVARFTGGAFYV